MTQPTERSAAAWGTTRFGYTVRRSRRRSTASIAIDPDHGVVVTAPVDTAIEKLDEIVHRKAKWITERLHRRASVPPPPPTKEYVSGESFYYLGRHCRLKVLAGAAERAEVRLLRGWLTVAMPAGLGPMERLLQARTAIAAWLRTHAAERLPERVAEWAKKIGVAEPKVLVRGQRKRWASCDRAGVLRFNWRIIQAPMRLVDYVVAHELIHLFHADHTRAFWRLLGKVMPDYELRRDKLRETGRGFEW